MATENCPLPNNEGNSMASEMMSRMGKAGTNLEDAKDHNLRVVIDSVRREGEMTRAQITRATGLSAQTISNLVGELEEKGLLLAGEPIKAKRGQPARPYSLNAKGGYSIGIQIDHAHMLATLVDLAGQECAQESQDVSWPTPEEGLEILGQLIDRLLVRAEVGKGRVLGAGIAIPGPYGVGGPTGIGPGWKDFPLEQALSERIGVPVVVENDASAAAIAERLHGEGKNFDNFIYIFIGMGLGAGLFLNGRIYRGIRGVAGEIGHIIVEPGGRPCECGNLGCLERYVSMRAAYEAVGETEEDHSTPEEIEHRLKAGDEKLIAWVRDAAEKLRRGILALETTLDPQAIFVGGQLPSGIAEAILAELGELLPSVVSQISPDQRRILPGLSAVSATAHGAASVPIFREFTPVGSDS